MGEINFVADPKGKKNTTAKQPGQENVLWTEPDVQENAKSGWFGFLQDKSDAASKDRNQALAMIKQYVQEKESIEPATAADVSLNSKPVNRASILQVQKDGPAISKKGIDTQVGTIASMEPIDPPGSFWTKISKLFTKHESTPTDQSFSGVLDTNLIKGEVVTAFDWNRNILVLVFYIVLSLFVLAGVYQALIFWEDKKVHETVDNADGLNNISKLVAQEEKGIEDILIFQKKLELIKALLDQHIYWTNFFTFLENTTLFDVTFSGFSGNLNGSYSLAAGGRDFKTLADQLRAFKDNELVEKVTSTGGTVSQDKKTGDIKIAFPLEVKIKPQIFHKTATNQAVK